MISLRNVTLLFGFLFLTACGGGGSSDGGGSENDFNAETLPDFAGTYEGTITATVNTQGDIQTLTRPIRFVISEDGSTIRVDNEIFPLESNVFEAELPLSLANEGTTCILNSRFSGTISEDLISGTVNGSGDCLVDGVGVVQGEISGYSGATRI